MSEETVNTNINEKDDIYFNGTIENELEASNVSTDVDELNDANINLNKTPADDISTKNDNGGFIIENIYYNADFQNNTDIDLPKLTLNFSEQSASKQSSKKSDLYYAIYGESIDTDEQSAELGLIKDNILDLQRKYCIIEPLGYNGSLIKNLYTLLKNKGTYDKNQKIVGRMKKDYNTYYHGYDLKMCIEYTRENNSFNNNLINIFRNTFLHKKEEECLDNHEKCMKWLHDRNSKQTSHVNAQYAKRM